MTTIDAPSAPVVYWQPDPRLVGYVTGYHRYRVTLPPDMVLRDVFFPSLATIRIAIEDAAPWSLKIGPRDYAPMPEAAFVGPTSHAGYCTATRGTLVGAGILPAGWARLFGGDVSGFANRVVPLSAIADDAAELRAALDGASYPAPVFDAWLLRRLDMRGDSDPVIPRIAALIDDPATVRIDTMTETLGIPSRTLANLTRCNFGFTPKVLLRRGRFLRALSGVLTAPAGASGDALDAAGYWDRSHFLRDSHLFLGSSVRTFLERRGPLNAMAMQARADVIGTAV